MAKTSNACLRLNVLFRNIIILRQDNIIVASFADILSPRHAISLPTNVRGGGSLRDGPKECLLTWRTIAVTTEQESGGTCSTTLSVLNFAFLGIELLALANVRY